MGWSRGVGSPGFGGRGGSFTGGLFRRGGGLTGGFLGSFGGSFLSANKAICCIPLSLLSLSRLLNGL